ncbi:hypothetical protein ACOMHN_024171 [Nucella lapillus]
MSRLIFNKGNLEQLRGGLNQILDIFSELLDVPFEHGNCFSHDNLLVRMDAVVRFDVSCLVLSCKGRENCFSRDDLMARMDTVVTVCLCCFVVVVVFVVVALVVVIC